VVSVPRQNVDAEGVLARGLQCELAAGAEDDGADVEEGVGGAGGDVGGVAGDGEVEGFEEVGFGDGRDGDVGGGVDDPRGVVFGAEDVDLVVWGAVCWGFWSQLNFMGVEVGDLETRTCLLTLRKLAGLYYSC
jgi:hypothetical protein